MRRVLALATVFVLLVVAASSAAPILPGRYGVGMYAARLTQAHDAGGDVWFLDGTSLDAVPTNTLTDRAECAFWTIKNNTSNLISIRIYGAWSPAYDGTFTDSVGDDYLEVEIAAGETMNNATHRMTLIGVSLQSTIAPSPQNVFVLGWNP